MTQEYIGTQQATAWEAPQDGAPGYCVKGAAGNVKWWDKATFESTFISLGHISHLPPEQQSVLGERAALAVKITDLDGFIKSPEFEALPAHEQQRRKIQLDAMNIYHNVLMDRIAAF
jgi:hypothetical protein